MEYYTPSRKILKTMLHLDTKNLTKEEVELMFKKKKKEVRFSVLNDSALISCVILGNIFGQLSVLAKCLHL